MSSNSSKSMRTPLGRVRNHGSGHSGTSDHWRQRISAVAMLLLLIPMIFIVMSVLRSNQAGVAQVLGTPLVAIPLLLFIVASVVHMKIGMQIVIEDYVHDDKLKLVCAIANNFFVVAVSLASAYAIFKLSSGV